MTLTEFLLARIAEDEVEATPRTVVVSGGWPAPEVPNCIGPSGTGDCPEKWRLGPEAGKGWWRRDDVKVLMQQHERTHTTRLQRRVLAECEAKRRIVDLHHDRTPPNINWTPECAECSCDGDCRVPLPCSTLQLLALPDADHPDYLPEWRVR